MPVYSTHARTRDDIASAERAAEYGDRTHVQCCGDARLLPMFALLFHPGLYYTTHHDSAIPRSRQHDLRGRRFATSDA
jgi:hypothetical protein